MPEPLPPPRIARREIYAATAVGAVIFLGLVAVCLHTTIGYRIDHSLTYVITGHPGFAGNTYRAAKWVQPLNLALIALALQSAGVLLGRPRAALAAAAIVLGSSVLTAVLKDLLGEQQMPSGHATAGVGVGLALLVVSPPRWRALGIVGAVFVGGMMTQLAIFAMHHAVADVYASIITTTCFAGLCLLGAHALHLPGRPDPATTPGTRALVTLSAYTLAVVALLLLAMGAKYSGRLRDLIYVWPTHVGYGVAVVACVWWIDRMTRVFLDPPASVGRRYLRRQPPGEPAQGAQRHL